jgi:hypothetical protein
MTTVARGQAPRIETSADSVSRYQQTYPGRADQVCHVRRDLAGHRGGHFTIRVALSRDSVRLECQDAGGIWRGRHGRQHDHDARPHGLDIIEALAGGPAGWGVQVTGDGGRTAWARLTW